MAYTDLRKLYYVSEDEYKRAYSERFNSPAATRLDFTIAGRQAFFVQNDDVISKMYSILRLDKEVSKLCDRLPGKAKEQYSRKCLIDEIVITNNIEGVYSSRKEIGEALSMLEEQSNRKGKETRFLGMVNKYKKLLSKEHVPLETCQDIRDIYDELVLTEVVWEDAQNVPDGAIFRKDQTTIRSATDREIHRGITPESKIIETMEKALCFLNDSAIDQMYRICLFHYMLEYIHPFYDGNGRLGRFILSYCISENLTSLLAFRISETIKENIKSYYDAFMTCNDPHNLGEVTPFLVMMLDMIEKAAIELKESLYRKLTSWGRYVRLTNVLKDSNIEQMNLLYSVLIQAALFGEQGISTKELISVMEVSYGTLKKKLAIVQEQGLLLSIMNGKEKYYRMDIDALDNMWISE